MANLPLERVPKVLRRQWGNRGSGSKCHWAKMVTQLASGRLGFKPRIIQINAYDLPTILNGLSQPHWDGEALARTEERQRQTGGLRDRGTGSGDCSV